MKKATISNLNQLFLLLTAIGFLALFIILSFNNRLASDDLYFLAMIKKEGLWNCFKGVYMGWSGRWIRTAYWFFVMTLTDNYQHIHYFLFAYHLITLILFVLSIQFIIRFLFLKLLQVELTNKDAFIFSIFFLASFYFFTFDIIESWWWICSSFAYLQGICFLLAGTALLLKQERSLFSYCCMGFCFLYIGGCFEIYALIVLGLFMGCIVYGKSTGKWKEWKEKGYGKAFFIALTCLLISMIICFVAPGNYQRRVTIGGEQAIQISSLSADAHLAVTLLLQKKLGVAILLSSLWMLLGMKLRGNSRGQLSYRKAKNVLLIGLITIAGSVLINIIFKMLFLKNALMPARTFTFTSFSIAAFMCLFFLFLGYYFFYKTKRLMLIVPFFPCCSMLILFAYSCKQYNSTTRYAQQHDALIDTLLLTKAHAEKEVVVHVLPDPGMLLQLDVEHQSWTLQEILDLPYEIRTEK
jgi:hypothetical protein